MDGTCLVLSDQDDIEAMIPGKKFRFSDTEHYYKTVNLYKFSQEFSRTHYVPFLEAYTKALGNNEYYEQVLKVLVTLDDPGIKAKRLDSIMGSDYGSGVGTGSTPPGSRPSSA